MNTPIDRRSFLRAAAGAALVARPGILTAATRADPMDRIGMTTVTFRFRFAQTRPKDYAGTEPLLRLVEVPEYFADRFGVHNLELWSLHFDEPTPAYLRDLKQAIEKARSRVINIQVDQPYNLADADEQKRRESIALVKRWVEGARQLGAPSIRANAGSGEIETAVRSLREINDFAAARGIVLLTENHGGISTKPEVLLKILGAIPSRNFGAVVDFGNFAGVVDRYAALARLVPHARLISAKTQVFDEQGSHTSFDFDRSVRVAEAAGFRGIYSAEQWDPSPRPRDFERIAEWMIEHIRANLKGT